MLILAGAGSGKTRVLTHRAAYLIEEKGVNPYHIMAITFTNKAAGEMRERIDKIVGFGSESIWVSTFHSSCVRILRRHIDRIGFDTNFTIYDADDSKSLMKDICKRLEIDTKIYKEKSFLAAISSAKDELITPTELMQRALTSSDYAKRIHFEDVRVLLDVLNKLVDKGNTVIVIEHNLDVVKVSDYLIDIGQEGGSGGGRLIATGTPEQVASVKKSYTGQFLKPLLKR